MLALFFRRTEKIKSIKTGIKMLRLMSLSFTISILFFTTNVIAGSYTLLGSGGDKTGGGMAFYIPKSATLQDVERHARKLSPNKRLVYVAYYNNGCKTKGCMRKLNQASDLNEALIAFEKANAKMTYIAVFNRSRLSRVYDCNGPHSWRCE